MISLPRWLFPEARIHRVRLEEEDFAALVRGGEVQRNGVRIILSDIGWGRMLDLIGQAMRDSRNEREE